MRVLWTFFGAAMAALLILPTVASAQRYSTKNFAKGAAEVLVQYTISVPLAGDGDKTQTEAMNRGRRMLYDMSAKECELILATIASSCSLESLNIKASVMRRNPSDEALNLSASARFQVELKPGPSDVSGPQ